LSSVNRFMIILLLLDSMMTTLNAVVYYVNYITKGIIFL